MLPTPIAQQIQDSIRAFLQQNCPLYFDTTEGLYEYLFGEE